jgi:hypothetical protein
MSRIQWEFTIDLPCEIGSAWKTPGRPLAVGAKRLEERRTVTGRDTGEDGQMQLQGALPRVEYPPEMMAHLASDVLDGNVGHQVEVDLGTDLGQPRRQDLGAFIGGVVGEIVRQRCVGKVGETAEIAKRGMGEAPPDHACLDIRVESHCHGCLDAAAHDDQVIDKPISGPAPGVHLLTEALLLFW